MGDHQSLSDLYAPATRLAGQATHQGNAVGPYAPSKAPVQVDVEGRQLGQVPRRVLDEHMNQLGVSQAQPELNGVGVGLVGWWENVFSVAVEDAAPLAQAVGAGPGSPQAHGAKVTLDRQQDMGAGQPGLQGRT